MARPLRLEFAGALYHVTSRGDRREDIYTSNNDREAFLSILGDVCTRYNWVCHAYCLMSNHYHLLIETPDANLSKGMRQLNGVYTQWFNRANDKVGHVFQGRYKAILVEKESYLLEVARYIVLNPVRAKMVATAQEWPWSSYQITIGKSPTIPWIDTDWLLASFAKRKSTAIKRYEQFVAEGVGQPSPWIHLTKQIFLGREEAVSHWQSMIDGDVDLSEIPSSQRRAKPKSIEEYQANAKTRNEAITQAYSSGGYTLKELGDYFGLHYSTVSGIVKRADQKSKT